MGTAPWPPMYELPSGLRQPDGTDTPGTPPGADGGVSDPGRMSAGVMGAPADSPALCPNCLVELDADLFCWHGGDAWRRPLDR